MSTPSWDDVEVGDTVVAEVRGTVTDVYTDYRGNPILRLDDGYRRISKARHDLKSVEKPVRTFKPGDVVRSKGKSSSLYTIGEDRHYDHHNREWVDWTLSPTYYELVV